MSRYVSSSANIQSQEYDGKMKNLIKSIERKICEIYGQEYCILTGSGTTAIYIAIKALGYDKKDCVIIPATSCLAPAYAAKFAGMNIEFCDVRLEDGNIDHNEIVGHIEGNKSIRAIVAVHLFGNPCDIKAIEKICHANRLTLLEDCAQAAWSHVGKKRCGNFGLASILSFGGSKTLSAEHGGALLTDDYNFFNDSRSLISKLDIVNKDEIKRLKVEHRNEYFRFRREMASNKIDARERRFRVFRKYRNAYLNRINREAAEIIDRVLENRVQIFSSAVKKNAYYEEKLADANGIEIIKSVGNIPWRFNFRISGDRAGAVSDELRRQGFNVSNLYPNLVRLFGDDFKKHRSTMKADKFEREIVNLFNNLGVTKSEMESVARSLRSLLEKTYSGRHYA